MCENDSMLWRLEHLGLGPRNRREVPRRRTLAWGDGDRAGRGIQGGRGGPVRQDDRVERPERGGLQEWQDLPEAMSRVTQSGRSRNAHARDQRLEGALRQFRLGHRSRGGQPRRDCNEERVRARGRRPLVVLISPRRSRRSPTWPRCSKAPARSPDNSPNITGASPSSTGASSSTPPPSSLRATWTASTSTPASTAN